MAIEYLLLIGSALILLSIALAKVSDNLGVPTLLLFLGIGMFAGPEGPGGITLNDASLAQSIAIVALLFILFAGGLDTQWSIVRPVFWHATGLATVGVFVTALAVGMFACFVLDISLLHGLLLGAIVSSTDAAAVFAVLRSKNVSLRGELTPLLELESGSNDPMAVFLTVGVIHLLNEVDATVGSLVMRFVVQMGIGAVFGLGLGRALVLILNRLRFPYEGIYPVFVLAFAGLAYGATAVAGGSGFLAVYIAGIVAGNSVFVQKRSLLRFFDGLAWLSQIAMFLTLGLLVFPSHIIPILGAGLLISAFLMFVARPLSVFLCLIRTRFHWRERSLISWVGLRGAVPIILATFPLLAGLQHAELMFNLVFFIVLSSALLQGWSIPVAARMLRVDAPVQPKLRSPIEFSPAHGVDTDLVELIVPYDSEVVGKSIVELGMPQESLVTLISRNGEFIVPCGGTILQDGDTLLVLVNRKNLPAVGRILSRKKKSKEPTRPADLI